MTSGHFNVIFANDFYIVSFGNIGTKFSYFLKTPERRSISNRFSVHPIANFWTLRETA